MAGNIMQYAENRAVSVLVSSVAVNLVPVELPEKGLNRLKAIPFLLEDQLVEDIKVHFAVEY